MCRYRATVLALADKSYYNPVVLQFAILQSMLAGYAFRYNLITTFFLIKWKDHINYGQYLNEYGYKHRQALLTIYAGCIRLPGPQIMHHVGNALQGPSPSNEAAGRSGLSNHGSGGDDGSDFRHQTNWNAGPFRQQKSGSVENMAGSKVLGMGPVQ